ncbi:MAG TPA: dihydrolipoamide acetyltransferase family protein [Methylomirabilota bacterium]|jgi:pyruvate dehydrogenase E2 component (dihydrolipoamide acetyltransferase)|nr:dihydrolipoamide acetyltransferase family protein [Methylomirabilota bacterium]
MPTNVIMPALEMAQETGKVLKWLKSPGDTVAKGESIVEIETDKVTVEIEAPASGILRDVTARAGDVVPVGQTIALIFAAGEAGGASPTPAAAPAKASPLARKIAEQHGVDLARVKTSSGRIEKADVLAYVESHSTSTAADGTAARLSAASPKARRLATERGLDITVLHGSGSGGAVLAADVAAATLPAAQVPAAAAAAAPGVARVEAPGVSTVWRIMAERMTTSWTTAPHFYLVREVNVSRLVSWLEKARKQTGAHITYTDLLVRLVAAVLAQHPRANASWKNGAIVQNTDINIGLAVAIDDGLVVPVLHRAGTLSLPEIATCREDLVGRAQAGKLRPADIQGGGFTISNLGMYGVDAFNAIVNPPQAAILAVGRIADRVVALNGQPAVQPTMVLTLSCDHRALDGARGAQFLGALADLIEEPLALLV